MLQVAAPRFFLSLTLILGFIAFGICNTNLEWRCKSGEWIGLTQLCDRSQKCADNSDSDKYMHLCTTAVPRLRNSQAATTPKPTFGCGVPTIPNGFTIYESDSTIIKPGVSVQQYDSIAYKCDPGYNHIGIVSNLCTATGWLQTASFECIKFCPNALLKGVTFKADCEKNNFAVECDDRIKPGTKAKISCKVNYGKPERNPPDVLVCQDDGQWDNEPYRCEPICGEEPIQVTTVTKNGESKNITYVPWHVGIFENFSGTYKHFCGGTIINAKVVISAAHCFWDVANEMPSDKSYYAVGAGKYYRDYYDTADQSAQYRNISQIVIPPEFKGATDNYRADIAVLILTDSVRFTPFISPICIRWELGTTQSMPNKRFGLIAGWGADDSGDFSSELRTVDAAANSLNDCKSELGQRWRDTITDDKFCVINTHESVVCQGYGGGGFVIKDVVGGRNVFFLLGLVCGALPQRSKCSEYLAVIYTNVQYFKSLILSHESANRPK